MYQSTTYSFQWFLRTQLQLSYNYKRALSGTLFLIIFFGFFINLASEDVPIYKPPEYIQ